MEEKNKETDLFVTYTKDLWMSGVYYILYAFFLQFFNKVCKLYPDDILLWFAPIIPAVAIVVTIFYRYDAVIKAKIRSVCDE